MGMFDDNNGSSKPVAPTFTIPHYYGDIVRKLFLAMGILMLLSIPFDKELLTFFLRVGVFVILVVTLLAGFTSPRGKWVIVTNTISAAVIFTVFEYAAIGFLTGNDFQFFDIIFGFRQLIALVALTALYFSAKTLRGYVLHQ